MSKEMINHPNHYGGEENQYEVIKIIEALNLDFHTGNAIKYIIRAGKKDPTKELEDLRKAAWYIYRKIKNLEGNGN
jgi:translation initiation factor 2 alpha subunit (eIF-2alpha)